MVDAHIAYKANIWITNMPPPQIPPVALSQDKFMAAVIHNLTGNFSCCHQTGPLTALPPAPFYGKDHDSVCCWSGAAEIWKMSTLLYWCERSQAEGIWVNLLRKSFFFSFWFASCNPVHTTQSPNQNQTEKRCTFSFHLLFGEKYTSWHWIRLSVVSLRISSSWPRRATQEQTQTHWGGGEGVHR